MSDNKLTEIPKEIGKLVNLESVWILSFLTGIVARNPTDIFLPLSFFDTALPA